MEIRFTLDPQFDAVLIARISQRSNNNSENRAAKFLMRYWHEIETCTFSPNNQRSPDDHLSGVGKSETNIELPDDSLSDEMTDGLEALDEAWK